MYAFDLIELNGDDLRREPLEWRKSALERLLARRGAELRWFWPITVYINPKLGITTSGRAASIEDAKSAISDQRAELAHQDGARKTAGSRSCRTPISQPKP
jgi:hypothetical protein